MENLQIQYRMALLMDHLIGLIRRMAHTVIPTGSSPEIYRKLVRSIYKRLVYNPQTHLVTVKKGVLAGMKKCGPFIESDFEFAMGQYEPEVTTALCKFCRPGMTVIDIGANAGYITILLSKLVGESGHVHAFEPIPQNVLYLIETLRVNALNNVTVHEMAVSDHVGEAQMNYCGVFDGFASLMCGGHGYYHNQPASVISVATITLDQFCSDTCIAQIGLIKIDIEGAEVLALAGMSRILATLRPMLIVELWGSKNIIEGSNVLRSKGYEIKVLTAWSGFVRGVKADIQTILAKPSSI